MQSVTLTLRGLFPLIMHNEQLSNPLNESAKAIKAITAKRQKTDQDYEEISRLEFQAGIYYRDDIGVYIPSRCIVACIRDAAKVIRKGTDVKRGVMVLDDAPLQYKGPRKIADLYKDKTFVDMRSVSGQGTKGGSRTIRTRPIFPAWVLTATVLFEPDVINGADLRQCIDIAGRMIGLCDYRPTYGRFEIAEWTNGA